MGITDIEPRTCPLLSPFFHLLEVPLILSPSSVREMDFRSGLNSFLSNKVSLITPAGTDIFLLRKPTAIIAMPAA